MNARYASRISASPGLPIRTRVYDGVRSPRASAYALTKWRQQGNLQRRRTPRRLLWGGASTCFGRAPWTNDVREADGAGTPCFNVARAHFVHVGGARSEEHTSELQSRENLVCR